MKMINIKSVVLLACLASALGVAAASADTVRVINNPEKVTVIKNGNEVRLNVTGFDGDVNNTYNYTVKPNDSGKLTTDESEGKEGKYGIVYNKKNCEENDGKAHVDVFTSGFYLGWGHTNATGADHGKTGKTFEVGVLNVVGLGLHFGDRNRLSLGMGYQAKYHELKKEYCFGENELQGIAIENFSEDYKKTSSELLVHTMQFPLLYGKGFGNRCWVYAGGVMNWNFYATYKTNYETGKTKVNESTRGLKQRQISFDVLAGLQWKSLGIYFRYSPQSVLEKDYGPVLNKCWTLGLSVGF